MSPTETDNMSRDATAGEAAYRSTFFVDLR